uniref:Uncharacterized protein n=1 Tax=Meloidogyne enterolobii TaxID=390850 RepID=A0A6V7UL42_MELEN|nr:unnamed protein product [Meloidogyne enterolobii]
MNLWTKCQNYRTNFFVVFQQYLGNTKLLTNDYYVQTTPSLLTFFQFPIKFVMSKSNLICFCVLQSVIK